MQVVVDKPQYCTNFFGTDAHLKYCLTTTTNVSEYCAVARTPIGPSGCAVFAVNRRMRSVSKRE
jgi:hypothetical protein